MKCECAMGTHRNMKEDKVNNNNRNWVRSNGDVAADKEATSDHRFVLNVDVCQAVPLLHNLVMACDEPFFFLFGRFEMKKDIYAPFIWDIAHTSPVANEPSYNSIRESKRVGPLHHEFVVVCFRFASFDMRMSHTESETRVLVVVVVV